MSNSIGFWVAKLAAAKKAAAILEERERIYSVQAASNTKNISARHGIFFQGVNTPKRVELVWIV